MTRSLRVSIGCAAILLLAIYVFVPSAVYAQQTLGSIDGIVTDSSGAVVPQAGISVRNLGTNLTVTAQTKGDGSFSIAALPIGTYEVTITKQGFEKAVYPQILVQGNLTATVNATLQPGEITTSVTVNATPLLNQTDTSNGYTLGTDVIQSVPLGTGSFTQLATLAPGTSADFLSGSGSNEGLGNQGIWANGQRDTSNSFTFNSVNSDNLFNGNSTSNMADSRFTLNTGEIFGAGGQVQTNTSVYDAIGEGLPTPPTETIQELQVTTSMYDASMGQKSGAHIELTTISGTNNYHGQAYEYFQNSALDAAPTFVVKNPFFSGAPPLHRNVFGGTIGGPIKKDKLFFFASYQRQQLSDALNGTFSGVPTLAGLTDADRTNTTALVNLVNYDAGLSPTLGGACTNSSKVKCITTAQIDPVALNLFQLKLKNGQYLIPSDTIGVGNLGYESSLQKFNSAISGPPSTFNADQANANIDYNFSSSDRIAAKYYFQNDPTSSPFAVSAVNGFPQTLQAGSQVFSLDNTTVVSPNATWEQRFGFIRQIASATTGQALTPGSVGLTLPNGELFPGITIDYADEGAATSATTKIAALHGDTLHIGPSTNFANAGVFQDQFEGSSKYDWVLGKHTLSFGGTYDYTQFNVDNRENDVAELAFYDFSDFLTGTLGTAGTRGPTKNSGVTLLDGETNRHFRAKTVGLYAQDDFKILPNLTVNLGVRWDWDGPLYEANGLLTNFYPKDFGYDLTTDAFNGVNGTPGIGIVVAGNNKTFGTKGVSDSTLTGRQWGFAPRIGVAWSPRKNLVVRAGFGMFYDRGEYFSELSTSAGLGISGPFSVTTQEPFTIPILSPSCANALNCLSNTPFGTTLPAPPTMLTGFAALVPDMRQMSACNQAIAPGLQQPDEPYCNVNGFSTALPFLFGGYAPTNVLPYSENWSLDLQWQPNNDLVVTLGYVGNRGVHEVLPIPFNQPEIATPANPVNNQIYSYGYLAANGSGCDSYNDPSSTPGMTCYQLPAEEVQTQLGHYSFSDGNTALRSPYIGISPNADLWTTNGISFYNALQLSVTKKMSHGLQLNASYTYSHALDEGSGLGAGLFFNGNNPLDPRTSYASSDFDRTHVFIVSYLYDLPTIKDAHGLLNVAANGWGITGVTTLETGEPFSIIDFSGTAGGIYYSADDYITNPLLPLAAGVTPQQASSKAGGGGNLVNGLPYVNPNDFSVPLLAPGTDGVPPCEMVSGYNVCDNYETGFGTTGRNVFREPFQTRFDFSAFKNFKLTERFNLKFEADAFNLFNHPSLDAPYSDFALNPCYNPKPCYTTTPPSYESYGVIDGTIGSNRFMQFSLHLTF